MKKACEIKRKVAENKVIRAAKAKSQSHWDTLRSSLPQKSVQSVVQRVTLRPAQVVCCSLSLSLPTQSLLTSVRNNVI